MTQQLDIEVESEFLACILQQSVLIDRGILDRLEPTYFSVESYQWMTELLKQRDWEPIALGLLDQELISVADDEKRLKFSQQLTLLYDKPLTFEKDANDVFRAYVAYCKVNSSITESFHGFGRSNRVDLLINEINDGLRDAQNTIEGDRLEVHDFAADYHNRQQKRRFRRDNPGLNPRLLTGISGLDEQLVIRAPMLIDFMAPFKRYKSIFLNAIGYSGVLQGFNMVHCTFENSYEMTADRYDTMFSGINYDRISNMLIVQEELDMLNRMMEWVNSWNSRLKIIKCTSNKTKVEDVQEQLKILKDKEGFVPDGCIWDYINLIAPSKSYKEERLEQKQATWDLKVHAEEDNVAVFTASQATMEGVDSERLKRSHRAKSIDISQALDASIAIDQTEKEKEEGIIILSPMFFRASDITIPHIVLDSDIARMQIDPCMYQLWDHAKRLNPYVKNQ